MAFSNKEIQEHFEAQTGRQPARATRLPSLDDYDRVGYTRERKKPLLDQDDYEE